jgi:hypothetical protein
MWVFASTLAGRTCMKADRSGAGMTIQDIITRPRNDDVSF